MNFASDASYVPTRILCTETSVAALSAGERQTESKCVRAKRYQMLSRTQRGIEKDHTLAASLHKTLDLWARSAHLDTQMLQTKIKEVHRSDTTGKSFVMGGVVRARGQKQPVYRN